MPIYEYKCDLCNGLWEEIQKFSDDPLTICKSCEKEGGVHKVLGKTSFALKGEGWAKDGYHVNSAYAPPGTVIGSKLVTGDGPNITGERKTSIND